MIDRLVMPVHKNAVCIKNEARLVSLDKIF